MAAKGYTPTLTNGDIPLPTPPGFYAERVNEEIVDLNARITPTTREVTAAGAVTVAADDSGVIFINKTVGAPTTVNFPTAAERIAAVGTRPIRIVDKKNDAATNNITINRKGSSDLLMGATSFVIDSNGASITLTPFPDGSGWY